MHSPSQRANLFKSILCSVEFRGCSLVYVVNALLKLTNISTLINSLPMLAMRRFVCIGTYISVFPISGLLSQPFLCVCL